MLVFSQVRNGLSSGAVGVSMVVLRHLHSFALQAGNKFPLISREFTNKILFRTFVPNGCAPAKGEIRMSDTDKLMAYILTLTPEQVNKAVTLLPWLTEAIAGQNQPFLLEQSLQIP